MLEGDGTAEPRGDGARALIAMVAGSVLFLAAIVVAVLSEGGPGEFAYGPFTPEPLPFAAMRGFTVEQLLGHGLRVFLATPGLLLIWVAARAGAPVKPPDERTLRRLALAVSAVSVTLIGVFLLFVLRGKAIVNDELTYRMQAELLGEGRLTLPVLPYLHEDFTVRSRLGFTGKYLFGEPLVQIPGLFVGYPALMHVPIAALTLWAFHAAVKRVGAAQLAHFSVILVASSPMFIMTSATGQSQATSLFCVVLAGLGYAFVVTERRALGAFLVGVGVGFGMTVRIQVAIPAGAVVVPMTAWALWKSRRVAPLAVLSATLVVWAVAIATYDNALSGSPLTLPWFLERYPEHYGFGQVWSFDTFRHTPLGALENLLVTTIRFNAWWLGWPSSLALIWLWFRYGRPAKATRLWVWIALATIVFELGYYSTGVSDTGPIYHYELLLAGALLGGNAIVEGFARDARSTAVLLLVQFGLGWTSFLLLEGGRLDRLVSAIHDEVDGALTQVKPPALLLYEPRCSESAVVGWVQEKLPVRYRAERDPIITYPRPPPRFLDAYLRLYPARSCWYFRRNPMSQLPSVTRCEDAAPLLTRPVAVVGEPCPWSPPTATRLGLYDPFTAIRSRAIQK